MKKIWMMAAVLLLATGCGPKENTEETAEPEVVEETVEEEAYEPVYACRTLDYYDYSSPVPASDTIEDVYFTNVFMGGDSRMGSLYLYSDLQDKGAEIHYVTSLSLWRIYDAYMATAEAPLYDLMMATSRNNIYLLIGINEIRGADLDAWKTELGNIIHELKDAKPDVHIYLLGCYHPRYLTDITDEQLAARVDEQNSKMKELAEENHIYYIDSDEGLDDEAGLLREDLTWDGLHLNVEGSQHFADFISQHVVREEKYVQKICE